MNRQQLVQQTQLAFDFVEKLYLEVSYLIKEVEGLLGAEVEEFRIGKPSGYGITTRGTVGLDPASVRQWPLRKLAVFFVPREGLQGSKGQTVTGFHNQVIYLRFVLDDRDIVEPSVSFGVLYGFERKNPGADWPTKFEQLMTHLEYNEAKVFRDPAAIDYEDSYVRFKGRLVTCNLYDITDTEQIQQRIIAPALELFREAR